MPSRKDDGNAVKLLVIGGSGFIGGNIMAHAKAQGLGVIGTQSQKKKEGLVRFDLAQDRIMDCVERSFFEGDGQVYVIICAFISDMSRCEREPDATRKVNVDSIVRLVNDVRALGARCVFVSTCFVFDGTIGYYSEDQPRSPVNEYGRQKAAVEEYLEANAPDSLIVRLDKIIGANPNEPQMLTDWHRRMQANEQLTAIEGSLLSPTYVEDVARGIVAACRKGLTGVYHLANSEFFYRDELARQFSRAMGRTPNVVTKPLKDFNFPDPRPLKSYLDGSRLARATGMRFTSMREVFGVFRRLLPNSEG